MNSPPKVDTKDDQKLSWFVLIPVLGYFWLLRGVTRQSIMQNRGIIIFNTLPFFLLGLAAPFPAEIYYNWTLHAITLEVTDLFEGIVFFVLCLPLVTAKETSMEMSGKYRNSRWYRYVGWSQLEGLPKNQVMRRFYVFNYHEFSFAFVGLLISTALLIIH